jgi:(2R)-ethylmalonyl-CoA mutase
VIEARTRELADAAREELSRVLAMGGAVAAVENAYMKRQLVTSHTRRIRAIESGELTVVGVNAWTDSEPSPLTSGPQSVLVVDEGAERAQIEALRAFRSRRNDAEVRAALQGLDDALASGANVMPPSIRAAHAGVTTGEWADALRKRFGEYRAPTGITIRGETRSEGAAALRERVRLLASQLGRPIKLLVGKPGLDGHSNGAEQIAVAARDAGMEVVYEGIRLTPAQIAHSARDEGVDVVGLSILSGSHGVLVVDVLDELRVAGCADVPVIVGGIIPEDDARKLRSAGVRRVYTPKDFDLTRIMGEIVDVVAEARAAA